MATNNDITGDKIQSRPTSRAYAEQWDVIYGNYNNYFNSTQPTVTHTPAKPIIKTP